MIFFIKYANNLKIFKVYYEKPNIYFEFDVRGVDYKWRRNKRSIRTKSDGYLLTKFDVQ